MTFKLYRAVPVKGFNAERRYSRYDSMRAPMNVPFVVDNLWELMRPAEMPSRRHAAYASPTPELALANASAGDADGAYLVCEVSFSGPVRIAHLAVTDARHHPDVRLLQRAVVDDLASLCGSSSDLAQRTTIAPLFMPTMTQELLAALRVQSEVVDRVLRRVEELSSFWASAVTVPNPQSNGELFFEVEPGGYYQLTPLA